MLLTICDKWAQESGVMFSTDPNPEKSKSKAMWVGGKTKKVEPVPHVLNGRNLPFVESILDLGHTLTADAKMDKDVDIKRFTYISN